MPSSSNVPITPLQQNITAPTPQNTPLASAPIAQGLSRPTVPDIEEGESEEDDDDDEDDDEEGGAGELGATNKLQAAMLSMVQSRLSTLIGRSSGYIESLPVEQKRTVEALKGIQGDWEGLQAKFKKEVLELEKKYLGLYQPLFDRRADLINGVAAATPAEIAAGEEISKEDDPEYTPLPTADANSGKISSAIPEFWLTALRNHFGINELITERDGAALKSLTDIKVSYDVGDKGTGFVLLFEFAPNEFFEEKVLTKTYLYKDEISPLGDYVYSHAIGCPITWKSDAKDLTKEIEIKKQRNKNTNRTRIIRKSKPAESWFNFFEPPKREEKEGGEDEDEEDWDEELEERLELDYQIGEDIKERVIPRAIDYFTGKVFEYDSISDDDEDDDEELDSDELHDGSDDDIDDDDDEDDEGPRVPKARRALNVGRVGGKGGKSGAANVDPEECKQQ